MRIAIGRNLKKESGPNIFTRRLFDALREDWDVKVVPSSKKPDIYFGVIMMDKKPSGSKSVLRVDGLYWNKGDRSGQKMNPTIFKSVRKADAVVFQSHFCKRCYRVAMGRLKTKHTVILNAVSHDFLDSIEPASPPHLPGLVANAKWRPTKRASSICKGFLASNIPHHLYMVGEPPKKRVKHERITWLGPLSPSESVAVTKACSHAIHLAKFDPCPNSVVEEVSCGLPVLHTDNGGTPEIVDCHGIKMAVDEGWDYRPLKGVDEIPAEITARALEDLVKMPKHSPPENLDMKRAAEQYYRFFERVLN